MGDKDRKVFDNLSIVMKLVLAGLLIGIAGTMALQRLIG
jgi:hypothetical protein